MQKGEDVPEEKYVFYLYHHNLIHILRSDSSGIFRVRHVRVGMNMLKRWIFGISLHSLRPFLLHFLLNLGKKTRAPATFPFTMAIGDPSGIGPLQSRLVIKRNHG
jgi:hypothetical protein